MRLLTPRWPAARRPVTLDAVASLLLAGLAAYVSWPTIFPMRAKLAVVYGWSPATLHWHAVGWLVAITAELAVLPLRRRLPVTVLAVTLAGAVAHWMLVPITTSPADVAVAIAVYTVADTRPRRVSAAVVVSGGLAALGLDALLTGTSGTPRKLSAGWLVAPADLIVPALALAAAWIAGDSARTRRAYAATAERRALDAERDRDQRARLAAAGERERITRELHDVIAHAISVMVIQAQGAGSALRRREDGEAGAALDAIVTTGRGALAETRRVLGVVRRPAGTEPDLTPQPALRDLPSLVARVRQAGTPVRLDVAGEVRPLPEGIELSAYRIVQEALTNTMKHAGPGATARVRVRYRDAELLLDITDDGTPEASQASDLDDGPTGHGLDGHGLDGHGLDGHGLAGMRARIAMLDGELVAGPLPGAGFRVRARLPVSIPAAAAAP